MFYFYLQPTSTHAHHAHLYSIARLLIHFFLSRSPGLCCYYLLARVIYSAFIAMFFPPRFQFSGPGCYNILNVHICFFRKRVRAMIHHYDNNIIGENERKKKKNRQNNRVIARFLLFFVKTRSGCCAVRLLCILRQAGKTSSTHTAHTPLLKSLPKSRHDVFPLTVPTSYCYYSLYDACCVRFH